MKVLHVNEHLSRRGGVETYLFELLPELQSRGITAGLAYGEGDASLHEPVRRVPDLGTAGFRAEWRCRDRMETVLEEEAPDLVHVHNVQNVGALQASLAYGPTVLTTHDYRWTCPASSFFHRRTESICDRTCGPGCFSTTLSRRCLTPRPQYALYFYRRAKWGLAHADRFARVIAPSRGARRKYRTSGFGGASFSVLPYPCPYEAREEPRLLPDPPTVAYVGRIAANKGHEYFIRALAALPDRVQGRVVGAASEEASAGIRELAERTGCAERLTVRGWTSPAQIRELLDATTVLVFPSLWPETLGIVGLEALSRGVPVVASDVGGVREWCRDGETGYLVSPGDSAAIADRIRRLLDDRARLRRFGERGIRTVREHFGLDHHADGLLELYRRVVRPSNRPLVEPHV